MPKPPQDKTISALLQIMRDLRDPDHGCPWDSEQTYATIAPYTIEEAYEVADAIENHDLDELKSELGDLLFQVVFHARMAEEEGAFGFDDVVAAIIDKMIRRHPHVYGSAEERARGMTRTMWDDIKALERAAKSRDGEGASGTAPKNGLLDNVPTALPALVRAVKLQNRAARIGFDWPEISQVITKLHEEIGELQDEIDSPRPDRQRQEDELGDVLFALTNLARHMKIDPEHALRRANARFTRRFEHIEAALMAAGDLAHDGHIPLERLEVLWQEAKAGEQG